MSSFWTISDKGGGGGEGVEKLRNLAGRHMFMAPYYCMNHFKYNTFHGFTYM